MQRMCTLLEDGRCGLTMALKRKELLTLREAAAFLKVGRWTLYRWCGEGKVPYLELHGHRRFRLEGLLKRPPDQGGEGASQGCRGARMPARRWSALASLPQAAKPSRTAQTAGLGARIGVPIASRVADQHPRIPLSRLLNRAVMSPARVRLD